VDLGLVSAPHCYVKYKNMVKNKMENKKKMENEIIEKKNKRKWEYERRVRNEREKNG
jgi:hypothetical protein